MSVKGGRRRSWRFIDVDCNIAFCRCLKPVCTAPRLCPHNVFVISTHGLQRCRVEEEEDPLACHARPVMLQCRRRRRSFEMWQQPQGCYSSCAAVTSTVTTRCMVLLMQGLLRCRGGPAARVGSAARVGLAPRVIWHMTHDCTSRTMPACRRFSWATTPLHCAASRSASFLFNPSRNPNHALTTENCITALRCFQWSYPSINPVD